MSAFAAPLLVAISGKTDNASMPRSSGWSGVGRTPAQRPSVSAPENAADRPPHRADVSGPMETDDETARRFRESVMPYLDDAYNVARYLTRNAQDADDIV